MDEVKVVGGLDDLKPYRNEKGVIEIVIRQNKKRIKNFQKVILEKLPQEEKKELLQKAVEVLNKNASLGNKNLELLGKVARMDSLNLILNGLNLCSTWAGFAILFAKLDKMSSELTMQIAEVRDTVRKGHDTQTNYEFNKVISDHTEMLDCLKKQQPFSEKEYRDLVDREYNVLLLLIDVLKKGISADNGNVIFSIFSLLSMFTASLRYFDESYYFNNHKKVKGEEVWHTAHDKWTGIFDVFLQDWFVEKLQDYALLEEKMTTQECDAYYTSLLDQVIDCKQEVEDNQTLILTLGDIDLLHTLKESTLQSVKTTIDKALEEVGISVDDPVVGMAYKDTLKQLSIA